MTKAELEDDELEEELAELEELDELEDEAFDESTVEAPKDMTERFARPSKMPLDFGFFVMSAASAGFL
jgi:hypothetical protein